MLSSFPTLSMALPDWVASVTRPGVRYASVEERMALVIELARTNVDRSTGGPFGAAVFDATGAIIAPGVNLVLSSNAALAHAEMLAIALAGAVLQSFDLSVRDTELVSSVEPCAMCLGAIPWSGVRRLVCGARDDDARQIGFDEGDKPQRWIEGLEKRGIEVTRDVGRAEAIEVLEAYAAVGGIIYNGRNGGTGS